MKMQCSAILCLHHSNVGFNPSQNTTMLVDTPVVNFNSQQSFQHDINEEVEEFCCSKWVLCYSTFLLKLHQSKVPTIFRAVPLSMLEILLPHGVVQLDKQRAKT